MECALVLHARGTDREPLSLIFARHSPQTVYNGTELAGLDLLVACFENKTLQETKDENLLLLWTCMSRRMKAYFPAIALGIVVLVICIINPRAWKHMCALCCSDIRMKKRKRYFNPKTNEVKLVKTKEQDHPQTPKATTVVPLQAPRKSQSNNGAVDAKVQAHMDVSELEGGMVRVLQITVRICYANRLSCRLSQATRCQNGLLQRA